METQQLENKLQKLTRYMNEAVSHRYTIDRANCLNFGKLFQIAEQGISILKTNELQHLQECKSCQKALDRFHWKQIGILARGKMLAAAGNSDKLSNIPGSILKEYGLPSQASILCERLQGGYDLHIQSNFPLSIMIAFLKGEEELFRTKISNEIPSSDNLIPPEAIHGWTEIRLFKK